MTDSVIIYRSRAEQAREEFWFNLVESYPTFFVGLFWILFVLVVTTIAYNTAKKCFPNKRRR